MGEGSLSNKVEMGKLDLHKLRFLTLTPALQFAIS